MCNIRDTLFFIWLIGWFLSLCGISEVCSSCIDYFIDLSLVCYWVISLRASACCYIWSMSDKRRAIEPHLHLKIVFCLLSHTSWGHFINGCSLLFCFSFLHPLIFPWFNFPPALKIEAGPPFVKQVTRWVMSMRQAHSSWRERGSKQIPVISVGAAGSDHGDLKVYFHLNLIHRSDCHM